MTKVSATKKEVVLRKFRVREILDATCRVVAQHGFQGATVERVAEEAAIAKGTVYLYFQNKESLFTAAVEQGIESFTSQVRSQVAETLRDFIGICLCCCHFSSFSSKMLPHRGAPGPRRVWAPGQNLCVEAFCC